MRSDKNEIAGLINNEIPWPGQQEADQMWSMAEDLFPVYRSLIGPGFHQSLNIINKSLPLDFQRYPSGEKVFDWTIPKQFEMRSAIVTGPDGTVILSTKDHPYHVWLYSQPFDGYVDLATLKEHTSSIPYLPDAIPLRQTYYRENWGLSAAESSVRTWKEGRYHVKIDTEIKDGELLIGEAFLPGENDEEILITSYLCHPLGANDNLSGIVVAIALFKLLAALPKRKYSYRLALWPESIGAITYIAKNPKRIAKTIGGYQISICGDGKDVKLEETLTGKSIFDRAARYAMKALKHPVISKSFNTYTHGSDAGHFNSVGLKIPMATITRGGTTPEGYIQYHSSADDLSIISSENLLGTLEIVWTALLTVERAQVYHPNFTVTPFLSARGIFPYHRGAGVGTHGDEIAQAYFELVSAVDGTDDLLDVAERRGVSLFAFDNAVEDFLRVGLMDIKGKS